MGRGRGCGWRFNRDAGAATWKETVREHLFDINLSPAEALAGCEKTIGIESELGRAAITLHLPPKLAHGTIVRMDSVAPDSDPGLGGAIFFRVCIEPTTE